MGRKIFLADFTFKVKMGSKVKNLSVKSLIRISTESYPQRVQSSNHFYKRILPSYGQTLITEHRKMGGENFSFGFCLIKNLNRTFSFETAYKGSKGQ